MKRLPILFIAMLFFLACPEETYKPCGTNAQCKNGDFCVYGTCLAYQCLSDKDCNGARCFKNVCTNLINSCTPSSSGAQDTRCSGNNIQVCTFTSDGYYQWTDQESCTGSKVCLEGACQCPANECTKEGDQFCQDENVWWCQMSPDKCLVLVEKEICNTDLSQYCDAKSNPVACKCDNQCQSDSCPTTTSISYCTENPQECLQAGEEVACDFQQISQCGYYFSEDSYDLACLGAPFMVNERASLFSGNYGIGAQSDTFFGAWGSTDEALYRALAAQVNVVAEPGKQEIKGATTAEVDRKAVQKIRGSMRQKGDGSRTSFDIVTSKDPTKPSLTFLNAFPLPNDYYGVAYATPTETEELGASYYDVTFITLSNTGTIMSTQVLLTFDLNPINSYYLKIMPYDNGKALLVTWASGKGEYLYAQTFGINGVKGQQITLVKPEDEIYFYGLTIGATFDKYPAVGYVAPEYTTKIPCFSDNDCSSGEYCQYNIPSSFCVKRERIRVHCFEDKVTLGTPFEKPAEENYSLGRLDILDLDYQGTKLLAHLESFGKRRATVGVFGNEMLVDATMDKRLQSYRIGFTAIDKACRQIGSTRYPDELLTELSEEGGKAAYIPGFPNLIRILPVKNNLFIVFYTWADVDMNRYYNVADSYNLIDAPISLRSLTYKAMLVNFSNGIFHKVALTDPIERKLLDPSLMAVYPLYTHVTQTRSESNPLAFLTFGYSVQTHAGLNTVQNYSESIDRPAETIGTIEDRANTEKRSSFSELLGAIQGQYIPLLLLFPEIANY